MPTPNSDSIIMHGKESFADYTMQDLLSNAMFLMQTTCIMRPRQSDTDIHDLMLVYAWMCMDKREDVDDPYAWGYFIANSTAFTASLPNGEHVLLEHAMFESFSNEHGAGAQMRNATIVKYSDIFANKNLLRTLNNYGGDSTNPLDMAMARIHAQGEADLAFDMATVIGQHIAKEMERAESDAYVIDLSGIDRDEGCFVCIPDFESRLKPVNDWLEEHCDVTAALAHDDRRDLLNTGTAMLTLHTFAALNAEFKAEIFDPLITKFEQDDAPEPSPADTQDMTDMPDMSDDLRAELNDLLDGLF